MKRLLSLILVFLLVFGTLGVAESIDFSSMSDEELLELSDSIHTELCTRGLYPVLNVGSYAADEDIAVGRYQITEHSDEDWSSAWRINIWKTADSRNEYQKAYSEYEAAYDKAKEDKEAGKDYSYPPEIVISDYCESFVLPSQAAITVSIAEGEVMTVQKYYSKNGYLTISKSTGLFMD